MTEGPDYQKYGLLSAIFLMIPFLASLIITFRKYDIRPSGRRNLRFFKYFLPLLIVCFFLSAFTSYQGIEFPYKSYYLTQKNRLIEGGYYLKVYDEKKVLKSELGDYFYSVSGRFDVEDYFIFEDIEFERKQWVRNLYRLDVNSAQIESIYESQHPKRYYYLWTVSKFKNKAVLLEGGSKPSEAVLVTVDCETEEISKTEFGYTSLSDSYWPRIFGTDEIEGKRFWLLGYSKKDSPVLQIWEGGDVAFLGNSQKLPGYINGILFLYEQDNLCFYKLKKDGKELIEKISLMPTFRFLYYRRDLSPIFLKEIYGRISDGKKGTKLIKLSLDSFEVTEVILFEDSSFSIFYSEPGNFYFLEFPNNRQGENLFIIEEGKPRLLKKFRLNVTTSLNRLSVFHTGIVSKKNGKVKVYSFPDMKELKFNKLR
jgi:hypothetical protein